MDSIFGPIVVSVNRQTHGSYLFGSFVCPLCGTFVRSENSEWNGFPTVPPLIQHHYENCTQVSGNELLSFVLQSVRNCTQAKWFFVNLRHGSRRLAKPPDAALARAGRGQSLWCAGQVAAIASGRRISLAAFADDLAPDIAEYGGFRLHFGFTNGQWVDVIEAEADGPRAIAQKIRSALSQ